VVYALVVVKFWGTIIRGGVADGAKTHGQTRKESCFCSLQIVILRQAIPQKSQSISFFNSKVSTLYFSRVLGSLQFLLAFYFPVEIKGFW